MVLRSPPDDVSTWDRYVDWARQAVPASVSPEWLGVPAEAASRVQQGRGEVTLDAWARIRAGAVAGAESGHGESSGATGGDDDEKEKQADAAGAETTARAAFGGLVTGWLSDFRGVLQEAEEAGDRLQAVSEAAASALGAAGGEEDGDGAGDGADRAGRAGATQPLLQWVSRELDAVRAAAGVVAADLAAVVESSAEGEGEGGADSSAGEGEGDSRGKGKASAAVSDGRSPQQLLDGLRGADGAPASVPATW